MAARPFDHGAMFVPVLGPAHATASNIRRWVTSENTSPAP
jgi:hypothetical protein